MRKLVNQDAGKEQYGGNEPGQPVGQGLVALEIHGEIACRQAPDDEKEDDQPRIVDRDLDARHGEEVETPRYFRRLSRSRLAPYFRALSFCHEQPPCFPLPIGWFPVSKSAGTTMRFAMLHCMAAAFDSLPFSRRTRFPL